MLLFYFDRVSLTNLIRHEGITSRIDWGFTTIEVMEFAGLEDGNTIFDHYYHLTEMEAKNSNQLTQRQIYMNTKHHPSNNNQIKTNNNTLVQSEKNGNSSIKFLGKANVPEIILKIQTKNLNLGFVPIIDANGNYLGNCQKVLECARIERQKNCLGCDYCKDDNLNMENIKKAIEFFDEECKFLKNKNAVLQLENAKTMLNKYELLLKKYKSKCEVDNNGE